MPILPVELGTPPFGTDGDTAREAFTKVNQNFEDLDQRATDTGSAVGALSDRVDATEIQINGLSARADDAEQAIEGLQNASDDYLTKADNLGSLSDAAQARENLELGTLAQGNSAADVPFDNAATDVAATDVQGALAELSARPEGGVQSVNGESGAVELDAADVGADPAGTAASAVAALTSEPDPFPQYLPASTALREVLSSPRTYYVRTDGSDSNSGLGDSAGDAFLTIQRAIDVSAGLDTSGYDVFIRVGPGVYDLGPAGLVARSAVGAGTISIIGDIATPSNVELRITGVVADRTGVLQGAGTTTLYSVSGIKLSATGTGLIFGLAASGGTRFEFSHCDFGEGLHQHLRAEHYGILRATGPYTISGGGASRHWEAISAHIRVQDKTITIVGTPNFDGFAGSTGNSFVVVDGNTFVGNATGNRYVANFGGAIQVNGAGETYLPGDSNGILINGGIYG